MTTINFTSKPPCTHGPKPCRFQVPPLNGSLATPEIFEWHALNNPDHCLFQYATENGVENITFKHFAPAFHRAGKYVADVTRTDLYNGTSAPVIAILATADTITTITTMVGMVRAGIVVFPLSPRFSAKVLGHLIATNNVQNILVSAECHLGNLAQLAIKEATKLNSSVSPQSHPMPTFESLYGVTCPMIRLPTRVVDMSEISFIVHSSSSTSEYPKAVRWTSRGNVQAAGVALFSKQPLYGEVFGCHGIELFHTLGLLFVFFASACGFTLAVFEPRNPAVVQTPEAVYQGYLATKPTYVLANPRFIQEWYHDASKLPFLASLKGVMFGGKLLSKGIGDALTSAGVKLTPAYGSTEAGQISRIISEYSSEIGWEFFELSPDLSPEFIPIGDGTYRLLIIATDKHDLPCINACVDKRPAFNTGDILVPHPVYNDRWRVLGRADDQIMLANGETVHPTALENILTEHPAISAAIIFGQNRMTCGVLLELSVEFAFQHDDIMALANFRDEVWPWVESINIGQCNITKEMIIVAKPSKPFIFNQKFSPKRAVILGQYQQEIDSLYGSPAADPLYWGLTRDETVPRSLL